MTANLVLIYRRGAVGERLVSLAHRSLGIHRLLFTFFRPLNPFPSLIHLSRAEPAVGIGSVPARFHVVRS